MGGSTDTPGFGNAPESAEEASSVVQALETVLGQLQEATVRIEAVPPGTVAPEGLHDTRDALAREVQRLLARLEALVPPAVPPC